MLTFPDRNWQIFFSVVCSHKGKQIFKTISVLFVGGSCFFLFVVVCVCDCQYLCVFEVERVSELQQLPTVVLRCAACKLAL